MWHWSSPCVNSSRMAKNHQEHVLVAQDAPAQANAHTLTSVTTHTSVTLIPLTAGATHSGGTFYQCKERMRRTITMKKKAKYTAFTTSAPKIIGVSKPSLSMAVI